MHSTSSSSSGGCSSSGSAAAVFFLTGVGLTYPWSAINAAVDKFVDALGNQSYIYIQAAFYLPLLPCLLLQTVCDERLDRLAGLRAAYTCRFATVGLGLAAAVGLLLPFADLATAGYHAESIAAVAAVCAAVGLFSAIGYGSACQCAARFDQRAVVVFSVGCQVDIGGRVVFMQPYCAF